MLKVMIVEDDNSMRFLLETLFQMEGFQVVPCSGFGESESIIRVIEHELPDAVFMDVHIGNKNGIDILKLIRNNPALNSLKVLMSSGMDLSHECFKEGANGFIMKPFVPEDLITQVNELTAG